MKISLLFEIKEPESKPYTTTAVVAVPENWHSMTEDDRREFLVTPTGDHMHPGQILYYPSPFQIATGAEEVEDFWFHEILSAEEKRP